MAGRPQPPRREPLRSQYDQNQRRWLAHNGPVLTKPIPRVRRQEQPPTVEFPEHCAGMAPDLIKDIVVGRCSAPGAPLFQPRSQLRETFANSARCREPLDTRPGASRGTVKTLECSFQLETDV